MFHLIFIDPMEPANLLANSYAGNFSLGGWLKSLNEW
jgi:hypothetical protein